MKTALTIVSIVAILAIGTLAVVLATGWNEGDDYSVTDAQANWCVTNTDLMAVAANNLVLHTAQLTNDWNVVLRISDLTGTLPFDDREAVGNLVVLVQQDFFDWIRWLGLEESLAEVYGGILWRPPLSESEEIKRVCLAAWGAEFGTP